jgi:hypothetical protein
MAAWDDYRNCCHRAAALDREAAFCPDCGHHLFRCAAADCRSLVTPLGHCPACIDLGLSIEKGAVLKAKLGECLSVPFVLRNNSQVRSLSVRSVLRDETDLPQQPVPITWEQLDAGRTRAFDVAAGPFAHSGINSLRLTLIVLALFDDVEETYAFSGQVAIDVESADPTQVVQNFNLSGADFGTAGMVVANPHASVDRRGRQAEATRGRTDVPLERAERYEIEKNCRGYEALLARMPRNVEFAYAGFPAGDRPADGPLLERPLVRLGRNGRELLPGNPQPNDLCLRIYDPQSGALDRDASMAISRRAADLILQNDRLYVRSLGQGGLALNNEPLSGGEARVVGHGDLLTLPPGHPKALGVRTTFKVSAGLVTQVRFEKDS